MGDFLWVFVGVIVFSVLLYLLASFVFGPGEPTPPAGEQIPDPLPDDGPLTAKDVADVRLRVVPRGYHMGDVDALLERIARELPSGAQQHLPQHAAPQQPAGPATAPVPASSEANETAEDIDHRA